MDIPILFLVFNRPDPTCKVFEEIKKARPKQLFIAADGPRKHKDGEFELCEKTRAVITKIDWPCEVKTLFREENLGCKIAVSSAIDWFFENVEEGIILEDDCLPSSSFFTFCTSLLEFYRNDTRVMHIGGTNFQDGKLRGDGSYYFSSIHHIWGWATWRRAWKYYDVNMKSLPVFLKENYLDTITPDKALQNYWKSHLENIYAGRIDTWDFQWTFAIWSQHGLGIIPNQNFVSNIGFGDEATHTKVMNNLADRSVEELSEIKHPSLMINNTDAEKYTIHTYLKVPAFKMLIHKINNLFKK